MQEVDPLTVELDGELRVRIDEPVELIDHVRGLVARLSESVGG